MENDEPSPGLVPQDAKLNVHGNDTTELPMRTSPSELNEAADTVAFPDIQPQHANRPSFSKHYASDPASSGRRPSVHFQRSAENMSRSRSRTATSRRMSSPPPPAIFKQRVSFDTFDNRDASDFSLTLGRKHKDYSYSKRSRTFLCGTDINEYSDTALEWLLEELVDDGDEIVCLRVVERDSKEARDWAGTSYSREGRERGYRAEARRMLSRIMEKNTEDRAISIVLEFSIGKIHETIQHMIRIYEPAMLVVGTRGKSLSGFQGLMPGSVSKYCLQHSPVPVIVVRPSSKRDKKKRKRLRDPSRRGYRDILDKSDDVAEGGHILDARNRHSVGGEVLSELGRRDAEDEARMVAEAVGYRPGSATEGAPLSKIGSGRSEYSSRSARSGSMGSYASDGDDWKSPSVGKLMKSPELRDLDTPPGSDSDSSDEDNFEPVPAYVLAQEEALNKARERAIKTEEEEREAELQRIKKENFYKTGWGNDSGKKEKSPEPQQTQGAAAVLGLLDDLEAQEKRRGR